MITQAFDRIVLVTGPARSGKSEWAERLAAQSQKTVTYIATAVLDPSDRDWQERIAQHQQRRPASWKTQQVPIELAAVLENADEADCLLVDSLGTWLANLLDQDEAEWNETRRALLASLRRTRCTVIFVSEETGWGVVPAYPIGRLFRDRLGQVTREIGAIAHAAYLVTGGHVLNLSQLGTPLPSLEAIARDREA